MRKPLHLVAALALFLPLAGETKQSLSIVHHFVETLRARVAEMEETKYQHRTAIDLEKGTYFCDCSGFLGFFLKKAFPESHASLQGEEAPWRVRPLAVTFHETFVRASEEKVPGWSRVRNFTEIIPGDLIAWRKDEVVRGESTGHVLLAISTPVRDPDGRYHVRVLDSTSRPHADDTRGPDGNGVGEGTMWFSVDGNFEPASYFVNEHSKPGKPKQIAVGRLTDRLIGISYGNPPVGPVENELNF